MKDAESAVTSATVPKLTLTPARATSEARAVKASVVSATGADFRVVDAANASDGRRETIPPSWSIAISGGSDSSTVNAEVSARSSGSVAGCSSPSG